MMLKKILEFFDRSVYYLESSHPAVFLLADKEGGGVLINSPVFSVELLQEINKIIPLKYIFFPSHFGAVDVEKWRAESGAQTIAYGHESKKITGKIDLVLERENRFSRTIDFLPMSGRTESACALRCKNQPGIIFFGPILERGVSGWPTLVQHDDDYSYENRLFGSLGLKDVKFEYAFTDDFDPEKSLYGPKAGESVQRELDEVLNS